ncbi:undecaprenyl-phosphate glucose phosphotransferase [Shewanella sp. DAU305]|uniref:undecaprenyl-phosphate glucose phosphotransferase n=1 Tax=Shewanella sp. DAU305 TaxID=2991940 RepID=UPI0022845258|nr:undecaprenyl-phosphate glucose phosphotransferase [Shewanella sp. DAU305]WAL80256.1 undecaprenyl-phosphate glucose phosphotransferase [Shewanella sp. DAU305]
MKQFDIGIFNSNQTIVSLVQRCSDILFVILGMFFSQTYFDLSWSLQHTAITALVVILFYFMSEVGGLYISWRGLSTYTELKRTTLYWTFSCAVLFFVFNLFSPQYVLLNSFNLFWFFTTLLLLCSYRIGLRIVLAKFRSQGINTRTIAIAGAGILGESLCKKIIESPSLGLVFTGYYDDKPCDDALIRAQTIGDLERLISDCKEGSIDRVYIALPMRAEKRIKWLANELSDTTVSVYLVPDIFMFELLHARSDVISGIPTISIYDSPLDGLNAILKRAEDVILSIVILTLIFPFLLLIAIAIKLTSKGPVFFKQNRYGIDGKPIKVWKFRSMSVMENGQNVTQAKKNDSRITPLGKFLRSTSLDELPQFINVLQGRMSIVGPRPHAVAHNEEYRKLISGYMLRHKVKPGITGWAQVNGWRGETDTLEKMEMRIKYDLEYIQNWTLWFDIKIITATIFKGFINKNAY